MPRKRRRPVFVNHTVPRLSKKRKTALALSAAIIAVTVASLLSSSYLSSVMERYGVAYARDSLVASINDKINEIMLDGDYSYDYFVILEKDASGNITALKSDMAHINALSSELIRDIVAVWESGLFDIVIPFGNLTGINIMSGRGPMVPAKVVMLTSSGASFKNSFSSAGINQTKHEIWLEVSVDADIFIPWNCVRTTVVSEILIAETVVVGRVPDTYLEFGK